MGFSRGEYWSGLPFPSPEDLPNPGIEPVSPEKHILAWRIPTDRGAWQATYSPWGHKELDTTERLSMHKSLLLAKKSSVVC